MEEPRGLIDRQISATAGMILVTQAELRIKLKLKAQAAMEAVRVNPTGRKPLGRATAQNATTANHIQIL